MEIIIIYLITFSLIGYYAEVKVCGVKIKSTPRRIFATVVILPSIGFIANYLAFIIYMKLSLVLSLIQ